MMLKIHKLAVVEKKIIGVCLLLTERISSFWIIKGLLEGSQMILTELCTYKQGPFLNIQVSPLITKQICSTSLISTSTRHIALHLSSLPRRQEDF